MIQTNKALKSYKIGIKNQLMKGPRLQLLSRKLAPISSKINRRKTSASTM